MENLGYDLFGEEITVNQDLKARFMVPPFTVLDSKQGDWQTKKRRWKELGLESELGRDCTTGNAKMLSGYRNGERETGLMNENDTSVFDPVLTEIMYKWFCPDNGKILDPFAGGSVRGVVANFKGYDYTGLELRPEQVKANIKQGIEIVPENVHKWYCGDSEILLDTLSMKYDFVFSCPPYFNLEKYSDEPTDLSNMTWESFIEKYRAIIKKSVERLKEGKYACFVVGEIRDKNGNYRNFVGETIKAFLDAGASYYNEMILLTAIGTACMRAKQMDISQKAVKTHQNILVFKK